MESKYFVNIETLPENTSHRIILNQIAHGSIVLECGCASGYMTRYIRDKFHAKVSIVEMNPSDYEKAIEYACDGICADLEGTEWSDFFKDREFDFILFADVLEHLRNPEDVLKRAASLLKENGTIIASIPNIAHADILINLLNGRWNYKSLGLLDNTHIHFWGCKNLDDLFLQAGLTIVNKDYTILPPYTTEQKNADQAKDILPAISVICHQPLADVYQFVLSAKKMSYVCEENIICLDHYQKRHLSYWREPQCCLEYEEEQRKLAALHEGQERLIHEQGIQIDQLEENNSLLRGNVETQQTIIERLEEDNHQLRDNTGTLETLIKQYEDQNAYLNESLNNISNSTCWKITKPIRIVVDTAKMILRKTRRELLPILYHIDEFSEDGKKLHIRGWVFNRKDKIEKLELMLRWNGREAIFAITEIGLERKDVESAYQTKKGLQSGFDQFFCIKLPKTNTITAYLLYTIRGRRKKVRINSINSEKNGISALLEQSGCVREHFLNSEYMCSPLPKSVDIIVPIYNGYSFLEKLFNGLGDTDSKHRVFLIDDNSTDERVLPALQHFASKRENVIVIHNEQNRGFVKTVNIGLNTSKSHVVILNTDVELPKGWIERLMKPVFSFENVASVTPFSNSATIFSFPEFGDNALYRNLSVNELDRYFQYVSPQYTIVPTGVGFCMGINRKALNTIGLLDDELFEKGYGEENDWCQRAIKAGFVNVHAENLFVYHKHGGSFVPEEKKRLVEEHTARLTERHQNYLADVAKYMQDDPLKNLRMHLRFRINSANARNNILVFAHDLGGGADMYLDVHCPVWQNEGKNVFIIRYSIAFECYRLICMFSEESFELELVDRDDLAYLLRDCPIEQIIINELVTYPALFFWLSEIRKLKSLKDARLTMLIHDYLAVSPEINLISPQDWVYEREGNGFHCDRFYEQNGWMNQYDCQSIEIWRQRWEQFLLECDEVRCFSEDSRRIMSYVYPMLENITVVPHVVDYMPCIYKTHKTTATLNIGILGTLAPHKGKALVFSLWDMIERENKSIKIVLIGEEEGDAIPEGMHFEKTGKYAVEDIPRLVLEKDIDIFLIPSIWPETFSYTTEEVIQMGLPLACLNIGAPPERVCNYEKGLVLSSREPRLILKEICAFARQFQIKPIKEAEVKRFLFIAEYISYSSRYRVDHAREQLFAAGIDSDFMEVTELESGVNLSRYQSIYVYRCRNLSPLKEFLIRIKGTMPIIYDIDDYIFAYEKIQSMSFLKQKEYEGFDIYCNDILNCMEQCDAFVTSTETLAEIIKETFPERRVFVNRNHASAAMYILSRKAVKKDAGHKGTILGYFSGSRTHDQDFSMIESVLITLMRKYPDLRLVVGGCCQISSAFDEFQDRVIQKEFVSWRELPALIRSVDINLMPLTNSVFNCCKSENKWTEAALVERVTVGTRNAEMETSINSKDIVFFDTERDFEKLISMMIESKEARESIAAKAYKAVCDNKLTIWNYDAFAEFMLSFCK